MGIVTGACEDTTSMRNLLLGQRATYSSRQFLLMQQNCTLLNIIRKVVFKVSFKWVCFQKIMIIGFYCKLKSAILLKYFVTHFTCIVVYCNINEYNCHIYCLHTHILYRLIRPTLGWEVGCSCTNYMRSPNSMNQYCGCNKYWILPHTLQRFNWAN